MSGRRARTEASRSVAMPIEEHSIPLVLSGPPRSGTTLLYSLFDGHPDIFWMISEGYFFEYLYDFGAPGAEMMCDGADRPLDDLVDGIREKELLPDVRDGYRQEAGTASKFHVDVPWSEDRFKAALANTDRSSIDALWRSLVTAYAAGVGGGTRRYACLKSPDYAKSCSGASRHFPNAKAIIISRDPAYVANSMKRSRDMRGAKRLSWPGLAGLCSSLNAMARRAEERPAERVRIVRYEDLVSAPREVMSGIASWLHIEDLPCLTEPTILGRPWPGHSSFAPTSGIETTPAKRELSALDAADVRFLRRHTADYARVFGYSL